MSMISHGQVPNGEKSPEMSLTLFKLRGSDFEINSHEFVPAEDLKSYDLDEEYLYLKINLKESPIKVIDELDKHVHLVEIDITEDPEIVEVTGIMGTPRVEFFKNKKNAQGLCCSTFANDIDRGV
ncbi:hypothetical protein HAX54_023093 [Datura stramonium]|uniref:Uncharacterized protein n=1 Tax=Datura stramonium TaxID=4076 RepID=A0ABS8UY65_DATST|nr:hypothetical protein [Datura stramonium]